MNNNTICSSLRAQIVLRGVVALRGGVDNEVPQLHTTLSEPIDYICSSGGADNKVPQLHTTEVLALRLYLVIYCIKMQRLNRKSEGNLTS